MVNKINKPSVFLSHSKKDEDFIKNLANDLRKCQIEPWLDTEELRHGKPWLKMIFEDGIPTCDVIIVYLTKNSINSKMVKKEIDAALIEQIADSEIAFLPYVSNALLRKNLRSDLRSLQCAEWNNKNYYQVLPIVVSEIWHSYLERKINTATLNEKNKRLELEVRLMEIQEKYQSSTFTPSENVDFQHIYKMLNKDFDASFDLWGEKEKTERKIIGTHTFNISAHREREWVNMSHQTYIT